MADEALENDDAEITDAPGADEGQGIDAATDAPLATDSGEFAADAGADGADAKPVAASWPEDWRSRLAGGDDKLLKRLERFGSVENVWKSFLNAEKKITSGEVRRALPENPSDEEVAAYRKDAGIPEAPDKYEIALPDGLAFSEADKPVVDEFLQTAHAANMTPAQVNQSLGWFMQYQTEAAAVQAERDIAQRDAAIEELREDFGNAYRSEMGIVNNFLAGAPDDVRENLMGARLADGSVFASNPAAIKWLNQVARQANPVSTVVPMSGDPMKSIGDEISAIEKAMKTPGANGKSEYWNDPKMQDRYAQLLDAQSRAS